MILGTFRVLGFLVPITSGATLGDTFKEQDLSHAHLGIPSAVSIDIMEQKGRTGEILGHQARENSVLDDPLRNIYSSHFGDVDSVDAVSGTMPFLDFDDKQQPMNAEQIAAAEHVSKPANGLTDMNKMLLVGVVIASTFMVVVLLYAFDVKATVLVCFYLAANVFVKFSVIKCYREGFPFPKALTVLHLAVSSSIGCISLVATAGLKDIPIPNAKQFFLAILPISMTFGVSVIAQNLALRLVSSAFAEVIASTGPCVAGMLGAFLGVPFSLPLIFPLLLIVTGCAISLQGEMNFSQLGCALCFASVFFRCAKCVLQQKLMEGDDAAFGPTSLMTYCCALACIQLMVLSGLTEGTAPFTTFVSHENRSQLAGTLLLSCLLASLLNSSALVMVQTIGAVGTQVVSQLKVLFVVAIGVTLLDESFTLQQCLGLVILLGGIVGYCHCKRVTTASGTPSAQTKVAS